VTITEETFNTAADIARRFNSRRFFVFGSAIDPTRTPRDLDFACEGVPGWKLFQFGAALEEALQMPVDLIPLDEPSEFGRMVESRGRRLV
jgi:predicted nucleotidyltransferase